jgi:hypothetical protein
MWRGSKLMFPLTSSVDAPHPDMPADAAELYEEARAVLPHSRRAAAALARASLERFLREFENAPPKQRLDELIASLSGRIPEPLWKLLTALRVVGNDSLHSDTDELVVLYLDGGESEVIEPLFGAINSLVEQLITLPAKADALYGMIPQAKRDDAERKAEVARSE